MIIKVTKLQRLLVKYNDQIKLGNRALIPTVPSIIRDLEKIIEEAV